MNSPSRPGQDPLDSLLREANEHIPDGGFTRRVMTLLPQRQARKSYRFPVLMTAAILCGAALLLFVYWVSNSSNWLSNAYAEAGPTGISLLLGILLGMAAMVWGGWQLLKEEGLR